MTNILAAALSASVISVVSTNWFIAGQMQISGTDSHMATTQHYQVERGIRYTNLWVVFDWYGSNHWQFMSSTAGETLPALRLIAREETPPTLRQPPPLPTNPQPRPTFRETGIVIIK